MRAALLAAAHEEKHMIKLNDTSKNVNILSDAQLSQVVGGRGHGSKHHKSNDYSYCHGGRRYDCDSSSSYDRGCDDYSYGCDGYDYGCGYGSSYGSSGYDKGSDK